MTACSRPSQNAAAPVDEASAIGETQADDDRRLEEQRRLESELGALEKRQAALKQRLAEQEDVVKRSETRIRELKQELRRKKAATDAYIDQHQFPVACAYASDVASGKGEYSEKTRECARVASMYCALAMISPRFRRKVATVREHIDRAEEEAQSLKKQISAEERKVEAARAELPATQESIDGITGEIAALRQRLPAAALTHF